MARFLNEFEAGRPLAQTFTAWRLNRVVRSVNTNQSRFVGKGVRTMTMPGGTIHTLPRPRPGTGGATPRRALQVFDASAGGADGLISVVAGSVTDLTNGGTVWTGTTGNIIYISDPTNGNVPFAVPVGTPLIYPRLQLNSAATKVYLAATVDMTTGFITGLEIDADTGSGVPANTSTAWYYLLSSVLVTITSGVAKVTVYDDGAGSSLNFVSCGALPLANGLGYRVGT